jgi:phytanoyl-CoA hydroxylase
MFKAPGGVAKPWHQDAAYWRDYASNQITVWIAIDDASEENGCVWAIPGSHKLGLIPHVKKELQVEESKIDLSKAVPVPVPAGGLLIFHSLVLHMSQRNNSDKSRWAIICDYDCLPNPAIDVYTEDFQPAELTSENVWPLRTQEAVAEATAVAP